MLQGQHSAILSTFIKLPIVIKIFVLSILSGPFTQVLLYKPDGRIHLFTKGSKNRLLIILQLDAAELDSEILSLTKSQLTRLFKYHQVCSSFFF